MTKVFVVLTAVLSITASVLFVAAAAQWDNWKTLSQTYQAREQAAVVKAMNTEAVAAAQLSIKEDEMRDLRRQLSESDSKLKQSSQDLQSEKTARARDINDKVASEADRKRLTETLSVQTGELTNTQRQNKEMLDKLIELQTRNQALNESVLTLRSEQTILNDNLRNLQEKLYASEQRLADAQKGGGAARPAPAETPTGAVARGPTVSGPIPGEITAVNGNYASINVGEASGVKPGMVFTIFRGDKFLAELVIDTVRPKEAGGKLITVAGAVQPGDKAAHGLEQASR